MKVTIHYANAHCSAQIKTDKTDLQVALRRDVPAHESLRVSAEEYRSKAALLLRRATLVEDAARIIEAQ